MSLLGELLWICSAAAVHSRSLTQSTKPTAAQILQTRLRKSIEARDAPQLSPQPRGEKDLWKDQLKVTDFYCDISQEI